MDWLPTIADRQGPLYLRIVSALADDIASGRLHIGQSLPTHRALAAALNIDLTTVTRAYSEARRQGLIEARVGRGTFVRSALVTASRHAPAPAIDLSMNVPPNPAGADLDGRLAKAIAQIRSETGLSGYLSYHQIGGSVGERAVAANWLQPLLPGVSPERLIIGPGTQPSLVSLLTLLTKPGDTILTEQLTYPGLIAAASLAGVRLIAVPMDDEGIIPQKLDKAARSSGAKLVYLMPTMHNPSTITMPPDRRAEVASIIARRHLTLIEDDPYSFLAPGTATLSSYVPQQSYLVASLAKCLAPGLRLSLIAAPSSEAADALLARLRIILQMPVRLTVGILAHWLRDGTADSIIRAIAGEAAARQILARKILPGLDYRSHPNAHHIWLPVPSGWTSSAFAVHLERRGLAVVAADAFWTSDDPSPNAIRVALGAARNRAELTKALSILKEVCGAVSPVNGVGP